MALSSFVQALKKRGLLPERVLFDVNGPTQNDPRVGAVREIVDSIYRKHTTALHGTVNHSAKEYVRGDVYTNTLEGYFSIVKRGIYGVYQHVSEAHLKRYLCEFDFRYSNRIKLGIDDVARTDLAVKGIKGKRLTYRSVGRDWTAQASA